MARRTLKKKLTNAMSERLQDSFRQQYKKANKQVKWMERADRCFYAGFFAAQATAKRELGRIYEITKLGFGKHRNKLDFPSKNKNGKLFTTKRKQR